MPKSRTSLKSSRLALIHVVISGKRRPIQRLIQPEQEIVTHENNSGVFSMAKNSEPLVKQMQERIAQSKEELKARADQIRVLTEAEEQE